MGINNTIIYIFIKNNIKCLLRNVHYPDKEIKKSSFKSGEDCGIKDLPFKAIIGDDEAHNFFS